MCACFGCLLFVDFQQWNDYVSPQRSLYFSFGFMAMLLALIPVVNFLFIFTNAVGVGMWAAHEHKRRAAGVVGVAGDNGGALLA